MPKRKLTHAQLARRASDTLQLYHAKAETTFAGISTAPATCCNFTMPKRKLTYRVASNAIARSLQLYHAKAETRQTRSLYSQPHAGCNFTMPKRKPGTDMCEFLLGSSCNFTMPKRKRKRVTSILNVALGLQLYHAKAETSLQSLSPAGPGFVATLPCQSGNLPIPLRARAWRRVATLPCQSGNVRLRR